MAAKFGALSIKNPISSWDSLGFSAKMPKIDIGVEFPDIDPIVPVDKAFQKAASTLFSCGSKSKKKGD